MKAKHFTKETISQLGMYERKFPDIQVGDTIAVAQKIKEEVETKGGKGPKESKERIQTFEGDVIAISSNGASSTFTVRKIGANSVPVERIFPFYSPFIESIKFINKGKVRRAKLFYLRKRVGKAASVEEKIMTREQREQRESAQEGQE